MLPGYSALFLWCMLSGVLVPLPEDVPQVYAGMRIAAGEMAWLPALAVASVGVFVRDAAFFFLGRALGERVFHHRWVTRWIPARRLDAARARVAGRGGTAVLLARFSIGVRSATFLVAGAMGVKPRDFAAYDLLALLVSVPLIVGLGYAFGEPVVAGILWVSSRAQWAIPAAVVAGVVGWWALNRSRRATVAAAQAK